MATQETNHYIQFLAQPISFPGFSITNPLQDNKKSILKTIDFETLLSYLTLSYTKFGCMALREVASQGAPLIAFNFRRLNQFLSMDLL